MFFSQQTIFNVSFFLFETFKEFFIVIKKKENVISQFLEDSQMDAVLY